MSQLELSAGGPALASAGSHARSSRSRSRWLPSDGASAAGRADRLHLDYDLVKRRGCQADLASARCACSTRVGREFPARPAHASDRTAMHWAAASRSKSDHRRGLPRCASRTSFCCSRAPGDLGRRRAGAARLAETELGERGRAVISAGTAACTEPDIPPSRALRCTPRRVAAGHCARARPAGRRASVCCGSRARADGA